MTTKDIQRLMTPRPGCIHTWCALCGRKELNQKRATNDPPQAVLVVTDCENHADRDRNYEAHYGADGLRLGTDAAALAVCA